jgi:hypothetical protein
MIAETTFCHTSIHDPSIIMMEYFPFLFLWDTLFVTMTFGLIFLSVIVHHFKSNRDSPGPAMRHSSLINSCVIEFTTGDRWSTPDRYLVTGKI